MVGLYQKVLSNNIFFFRVDKLQSKIPPNSFYTYTILVGSSQIANFSTTVFVFIDGKHFNVYSIFLLLVDDNTIRLCFNNSP